MSNHRFDGDGTQVRMEDAVGLGKAFECCDIAFGPLRIAVRGEPVDISASRRDPDLPPPKARILRPSPHFFFFLFFTLTLNVRGFFCPDPGTPDLEKKARLRVSQAMLLR